ncbi:chorion peroxidase-like [Pollicipes pollicipes]|uniref:chorion peroxidase-like n=1 Tax=Pollicipes pollicipes TaxID=41117 RepID=UPI0018855F9D|nr:chorion peroxidase-like [Pollicipes pollicipes]
MHDTAVLGSHARKVNVTRLLTEQRLEAQLLAEGRVPQPNSAAYKQMLNALSTDEAQELGRAGLRQSLTLCGCSGFRDNSTGNVTQRADRSPHPAVHLPYCEPEPVPHCQRSRPFRTSDGECNNLMHPRWGRALTGLGRLLPNTYDDGLFRSAESDAASAALVAFGQFLAHDTIQTPVYRINAHTGLQCCGADGSAPPTPPVHPQCFPIEVAADDPFYGTLGRRCLNLVRSLEGFSTFYDVRGQRRAELSVEFTTAAFRHGHSQRVDGNSERAVFGDLFRSQQPSGLDLPALNVQRGPRPRPYVDAVALCLGLRLTTWYSLRQLIPEEDVTRLRTVYSSPRDVDLYIGGSWSATRPRAGRSHVPVHHRATPSSACASATGFFYDNGELVHSFSPVQLREVVRHTSLGDLSVVLSDVFACRAGVDLSVF